MNPVSVCFAGPRDVEVEEGPSLPPPGPGQVLVKTRLSAISSGTELLIYRGEAPPDLVQDEALPSLRGDFRFPVRYGYAAVGRVVERGEGVEEAWEDRRVFAFHPHASHFLATVEELVVVPPDVPWEAAAFLPNMESAVSFVMDGRPVMGEEVVVFGQGVVGLLTTYLLARFPLGSLITLDCFALRRQRALALGAGVSLDPLAHETQDQLRALLRRKDRPGAGADLTYELSGNPEALQQAIATTGYSGRVVVGSWYGVRPVTLELGSWFHRGALSLVSSQVSRLAPRWRGRWTKARRLAVAWESLRRLSPQTLITHRFAVGDAAAAYALLDEQPSEAIQVVLEYGA